MKPNKKRPTAKRTKQPETRNLPWEGTLTATALFLTALLWVSSFFPEERLWGFNHGAYFPLWLRTMVVAFGLVVFVPPINRKLQSLLKRSVVAAFDHLVMRQRYSGYLFAGAISLLAFYLLRTQTQLLGDGFQIVQRINAGSLSLHWSQPLAIWIYLTSFDLLGPIFNLDGATLYALVSYLSGVIYVVLALRMAVFLGRDSSTRLFTFLILMLMGGTQLFFGYAEHYPLLYSGLLMYLFYSLKYLRGEAKILAPLAIFIVLVPLHFSSLSLIPSLVLLFLLKGERKVTKQDFSAIASK